MEKAELEIDDHQQRLLTAFGSVLRAETAISEVKQRQADVEALLSEEKRCYEAELSTAWEDIKVLMEETGEFEIVLPGEVMDFKIGWSTPRETVKAEPDATPEEFCKTEKKPKLKEIAEHLNLLRSAGADLPNWASFQIGEAKLGWKAIKRKQKP